MRLTSLLLKAAILVPVLYFGALIGAATTWPGYSHITQYASELGSAAAPRPELFNYPIIAGGVAAILGALGVFLGMRRVQPGVIWPLLAALCLAAWGASMVFGGLYPMPDPRHNGYMLGLAIIGAPLFMFLGLSGRSDMGGVKALLILSFLATVALTAVMFNVGELNLVRQSNVGLWQRGYALASILWIGLAALGLDKSVSARVRRDAERQVSFSG